MNRAIFFVSKARNDWKRGFWIDGLTVARFVLCTDIVYNPTWFWRKNMPRYHNRKNQINIAVWGVTMAPSEPPPPQPLKLNSWSIPIKKYHIEKLSKPSWYLLALQHQQCGTYNKPKIYIIYKIYFICNKTPTTIRFTTVHPTILSVPPKKVSAPIFNTVKQDISEQQARSCL